MIIRQIALLSESAKVSSNELLRVSAALQRQVTRDFAPIWNVRATVDPFESADHVPPGYWRITVLDTTPAKGTAGFHLDEHGQPVADILWSPNWSLTASHDCLEMLADPFGHHLASGPSVKKGQGRVTYLVEVCDPCEAPQFAYMINTGLAGHEVVVSDFYTPSYFEPLPASGVRYSFRGNLTSPRQVLDGGYLSWLNPEDGHIWQLFGPAEMGHFQDAGAGTLNRQRSGKLVRKIRASTVVTPPDSATKCNLARNPLSGVLSGKVGKDTTVSIQDESGVATFVSISYDGTQIGSATTSATFTIDAGRRPLSFVYAAPVPGAQVKVVDPCGTVLDRFLNDFGNPIRIRTVEGI